MCCMSSVCVGRVLFVLGGAGLTGLPVPAAVPVSFEPWNPSEDPIRALPRHGRAAELPVRAKCSDTQLCWPSLELKWLRGMFTASCAGKRASDGPKQTNPCFWLSSSLTPAVQGFDHSCRLQASKVLYRLK